MNARHLLADSRGVAFITVLYVVFALGMMLFAFAFLSQNEVGFAAYNRNSTIALGLAEAGAQEAVNRVKAFGVTLGPLPAGSPCPRAAVNAFSNSLAAGAPGQGAGGTVVYGNLFQSEPSVFPVLSCATFGGAQRWVRVLVRATTKTGFGRIILGPQVTFQGNAQPVAGDTYSQTSIVFQQYSKSPPPASGATATNLLSPQVLGGTTIGVRAGGPGTYTYECANGSLTEVAPTPCPGGGRSSGLPVNWHPMTPAGMKSADFNTVVQQWVTNPSQIRGYGISVTQATQNGAGVTYTPVSYRPAYWSIGAQNYNGQVLLVTASQPFCVNSTAGQVQQASGNPPVCPGGYTYYGSNVSGTNYTTRYVDWGLVQDDLTRQNPTTFFAAPTCTSCVNNGPDGNQNGVRYIPLAPVLNVLAQACTQNVNPGLNVFDNAIGDPSAPTCTNPPTQTISSTNVTFTGTQNNPEFLVIDNGPPNGTVVHINGSPQGPGSCSSNFASYNWGVIMATGDIDLTANMVFSGFIYTPGNVISHGTVVVNGGIFAAGTQSNASQVNQVDTFGTVNFCTGSSSIVVLSPTFYNFSQVSWQDRPLNQP